MKKYTKPSITIVAIEESSHLMAGSNKQSEYLHVVVDDGLGNVSDNIPTFTTGNAFQEDEDVDD